jgi:hypothetical protein
MVENYCEYFGWLVPLAVDMLCEQNHSFDEKPLLCKWLSISTHCTEHVWSAQVRDDGKMEVKPSPLWGASDLLDPVEALSMKVDELNQKLDALVAAYQSSLPNAHTG